MGSGNSVTPYEAVILFSQEDPSGLQAQTKKLRNIIINLKVFLICCKQKYCLPSIAATYNPSPRHSVSKLGKAKTFLVRYLLRIAMYARPLNTISLGKLLLVLINFSTRHAATAFCVTIHNRTLPPASRSTGKCRRIPLCLSSQYRLASCEAPCQLHIRFIRTETDPLLPAMWRFSDWKFHIDTEPLNR